MKAHAYIPNERRIILALRYDDSQMTEAQMLDTLSEQMHELDGRFVKPAPDDTSPVDGGFDWSFTTLDRADPVASLEVMGDVDNVQSVLPIRITDPDTLRATTWLDGTIIAEEDIPPEGDPNRIRLAEGHLVKRDKPVDNGNRTPVDGYTPADISDFGWAMAMNNAAHTRMPTGDGEWTHTENRDFLCPAHNLDTEPETWATWTHPWFYNGLCDEHQPDWEVLAEAGTLQYQNPAYKYVRMGMEQNDAIATGWMMDRTCFTCQDTYAAHYGERCPVGGTTFLFVNYHIGYDNEDNPIGIEDWQQATKNNRHRVLNQDQLTANRLEWEHMIRTYTKRYPKPGADVTPEPPAEDTLAKAMEATGLPIGRGRLTFTTPTFQAEYLDDTRVEWRVAAGAMPATPVVDGGGQLLTAVVNDLVGNVDNIRINLDNEEADIFEEDMEAFDEVGHDDADDEEYA